MRQALSREDNRRAWLTAAVIVCFLLALAALFLFRPAFAGGVRLSAPGQTLLDASAGLDRISVQLTFDPSDSTAIHAVQTLTLTNRTGVSQPAILLRSYTGAYLTEEYSPAAGDELYEQCYPAGFNPGGVQVELAGVDGSPASIAWQDGRAMTVLRLGLDAPWLPGEERTVTLVWQAVVPECSSRFGLADGVWALGNLIPVPALWENGDWVLDPYGRIGDPFQTACANWQVEVSVPDGFQVAASAYAEPESVSGHSVYRFETLAARDFAMAISDRFCTASAMEGSTLVSAFALDQSYAFSMVSAACKALRCFSGHWGEYAYPSFTCAQVTFPFGGMEYPGFVMIGTSTLSLGPANTELTVAHEAAHQWWAIQVGSDSVRQPWQDESLTTYSTLTYISDFMGAHTRDLYDFLWAETAMRVSLPQPVTPGSPCDYFDSLSIYSTVVYNRGAAFWNALEKLMGVNTLHEALADYHAQYRFSRASRSDLTRIPSQHAGMDLEPFMADYLDTLLN